MLQERSVVHHAPAKLVMENVNIINTIQTLLITVAFVIMSGMIPCDV